MHTRGLASVRVAKAIAIAGNSSAAAVSFAESQRWGNTPEVCEILRGAVTAMDTSTSLAATRVDFDWAAYLRPQTILGRLPLVSVPFMVRMLLQSAGASGYWVGEGKPIAVSRNTLSSSTLEHRKVAAMAVITRELLQSSAPNAEVVLQRDLGRANVARMDQSFIDPDNAGVTDVEPASVLNGVTPITATGTTAAAVAADLASILQALADAGSDLTGAHFVMRPKTALYLSQLTGTAGAYFPKLGARGGEIWGVPVIVSAHAVRTGSPGAGESVIAVVDANEICLADDGQSEFSSSTVTAVEQTDNPTNDASTGTAASMVSMFQTHCAAIKMVRMVHWAKRRTGAAQWYSTASY